VRLQEADELSKALASDIAVAESSADNHHARLESLVFPLVRVCIYMFIRVWYRYRHLLGDVYKTAQENTVQG